MAEYKGVACPVPNCEGFLKSIEEHGEEDIRCEYGHLIVYE
jgi:hypothetical protein